MSFSKKNLSKKTVKVSRTQDFKNLHINLNPFGEVETSLEIDQVNQFLDANLSDKKLGNKLVVD
jgi:hypothetical protein